MSLYQFFGSEKKVNHERMEKLLGLLQEHTRPVRPELLGVIGEKHLRQLMVNAGGEPKSVKYIVKSGIADGVPYMVEIALCPFKVWVDGGEESDRLLITGVNFSATLENPFDTFRGMAGMSEILAELRPGKKRRSSSAFTTPARTSNIWIAARAASAWSKNHGCRRRY